MRCQKILLMNQGSSKKACIAKDRASTTPVVREERLVSAKRIHDREPLVRDGRAPVADLIVVAALGNSQLVGDTGANTNGFATGTIAH